MALVDFSLWQWLSLVQHELLLFAGIFFLIGAIDDLAIDLTWLWLKCTGRARSQRINRKNYSQQKLGRSAAVFIPAWNEAAVIGHTISHMLKAWPQEGLRLYVGCYRNDPATIAAVTESASADPRLRLVIHDRLGPTTKGDCLNRLYAAMRNDERRMGGLFGFVVFHDAEDLVDPAALSLLDRSVVDGADFAQLPVEPLVQRRSRFVGSHYCEEFAESHGKAMVVRDAIGAALPGAGVGCAVSRPALQKLCRRRYDLQPFCADSLTEDYELGLAIAEGGGSCRFVRARCDEDGSLIATRAYFPTSLGQAVRQKTRWVHGIALQGWDRIGWSQGFIETWMRARDRRGPLTSLVLAIGYILLALTLAIWSLNLVGIGQPIVMTPLLKLLLTINLCAFAWRAVMRFAFTARNYGFVEGVLAIVRIPLSNVIAIIAGRRAVFAYLRTLFGHSPIWDKTQHDTHPAKVAHLAIAVP